MVFLLRKIIIRRLLAIVKNWNFNFCIVYLNYNDDKNIDSLAKREKFEDIVEDFSLKKL